MEEFAGTTTKAAKKKIPAWIALGVTISLIFSLLLTSFYGLFKERAKEFSYVPYEEESLIEWIYQSSYVLYRDLYNKVNNTDISYLNLYLQQMNGKDWDSLVEAMELSDYTTVAENLELPGDAWNSEEESAVDTYDLAVGLGQYVLGLQGFFQSLDENYPALNVQYDYLIEDLATGEVVTNLTSHEIDASKQFFMLSFEFDEHGMVSLGETVIGSNTTNIRKTANGIIRRNSLSEKRKELAGDTSITQLPATIMPANCRVTYCIDQETWAQTQEDGYLTLYSQNASQQFWLDNYDSTLSFIYAGCGSMLVILCILSFLAAFFLPKAGKGEPWVHVKLCRLPFEGLFCIGVVWLALYMNIGYMAAAVNDDSMAGMLHTIFFGGAVPFIFWKIMVYLFNILVLCGYFFAAWYVGISFRAVRAFGIRRYVRERSIIYRFFPYVKSKLQQMYDTVAHFDVTRNAHKLILRVVLVNAVILLVISSLWMGGVAVTLIYSLFLYFILRKYISELQKKYSVLLGATNEIAQGNLNVAIVEDLGVFEPFKPQIIRIQNGFKNAVEQEVRSQKMKAELITNVSHDLKTPLTAIITYINLLKEPDITQEQRREYLDTLERKSLRLKVLIEDLFEVSKANAQSVTLNIMDVDIMHLVKQVSFEMADKLSASNLDIRLNLSEERVVLPLDSQKTYRIYENLFGNIAKYALPGTRVYVNGFRIDDTVVITLKNITAQELDVRPEDLTERFVRGDASRNTEGSGLGLAIAKSFTELQGGQLSIQIDGDLFKATTTWKLPT